MATPLTPLEFYTLVTALQAPPPMWAQMNIPPRLVEDVRMHFRRELLPLSGGHLGSVRWEIDHDNGDLLCRAHFCNPCRDTGWLYRPAADENIRFVLHQPALPWMEPLWLEERHQHRMAVAMDRAIELSVRPPVVGVDYGGFDRAAAVPAAAGLTINDIVRIAEESAHARFGRAEAVDRGEKLLREWLSPAQLDQYEASGSFDVTGCKTGRRYRIDQSASFNVKLLRANGSVEEEICFMPEGPLVAGDVMLAQKIALETDETAALAVANRRYLGPEPVGLRFPNAFIGIGL